MVINANPNRISGVLLHAAGLLTCGLTVLAVWMAIALVHNLVPEQAPAAAQPPRDTSLADADAAATA